MHDCAQLAVPGSRDISSHSLLSEKDDEIQVFPRTKLVIFATFGCSAVTIWMADEPYESLGLNSPGKEGGTGIPSQSRRHSCLPSPSRPLPKHRRRYPSERYVQGARRNPSGRQYQAMISDSACRSRETRRRLYPRIPRTGHRQGCVRQKWKTPLATPELRHERHLCLAGIWDGGSGDAIFPRYRPSLRGSARAVDGCIA